MIRRKQTKKSYYRSHKPHSTARYQMQPAIQQLLLSSTTKESIFFMHNWI